MIEQVGKGRLERLERWLKATARHAPGEDDDALAEIAAWPNAQLKQLWIDANVLTQVMCSEGANRFTVLPEGQRLGTQVRYTQVDLHRLQVLACAAAVR